MKTKLEFIAAWNCCCLLYSWVEDCVNVRPLDTVSEEGELSIYFVNSHPPAQHLVLFSMKFSGIVINLCFFAFVSTFRVSQEPGILYQISSQPKAVLNWWSYVKVNYNHAYVKQEWSLFFRKYFVKLNFSQHFFLFYELWAFAMTTLFTLMYFSYLNKKQNLILTLNAGFSSDQEAES